MAAAKGDETVEVAVSGNVAKSAIELELGGVGIPLRIVVDGADGDHHLTAFCDIVRTKFLIAGGLSTHDGCGWEHAQRFVHGCIRKRHAFEIFGLGDRKSTRLNSSHVANSYAVFCLKKKNKTST